MRTPPRPCQSMSGRARVRSQGGSGCTPDRWLRSVGAGGTPHGPSGSGRGQPPWLSYRWPGRTAGQTDRAMTSWMQSTRCASGSDNGTVPRGGRRSTGGRGGFGGRGGNRCPRDLGRGASSRTGPRVLIGNDDTDQRSGTGGRQNGCTGQTS